MLPLYKHKEKRLRSGLDTYCRDTNEGEWITPLNPDNIPISFFSQKDGKCSQLLGEVIYLNDCYEAKQLFPCYIKELWHIKQKREQRWKYWLYRIFAPRKINNVATEKEILARHWMCE
jgi:hypothetical protein